jgi:hypothetical protein
LEVEKGLASVTSMQAAAEEQIQVPSVRVKVTVWSGIVIVEMRI